MKTVDILLVEDNFRDVILVEEALKECGFAYTLRVASDGEEALLVLRAFRPSLILLDLNLPKRDGLEVLKEIKEDPVLRAVPTVILTNSLSEEDVDLAYSHHCNAYVRKPLGYEAILDTMDRLGKFWFERVTLPNHHSTPLPPTG